MAEKKPPSRKRAYSICDLEVHDPRAFDEYVLGHVQTVEKYGGRFLVASGPMEIIEGDWQPKRVVIHEWPSMDAFHEWYHSEDYRPWKEMRGGILSAKVVLVKGLIDNPSGR